MSREGSFNVTVRRAGPFVAIFALALLVRVAHLVALWDAPFFGLLLGDSEAFDAWARRLAAGDWLGDEVFWYAPLYPYLLGVVYKLLGDGALNVRLLQAGLGSLSCVFLALAGTRLISRRVGLVAGTLLALYAPAVFLDGLVHKPVLVAFLLCLSLWLIGRILDGGGGDRSWLVVGLALGCLVLTREHAMAMVAGVAVWLLLRHRAAPRRAALSVGLLAAGAALVLIPVAVRNQLVGGQPYLTGSNFGYNLYTGNNERSDGTYQPLRFGRGNPRFEQRDAMAVAEQAAGRALTASEVSAFWRDRALDYMRGHPGAWLALEARKLALILNAAELPDAESQYAHADWSAPLRGLGLLFHFGVMVTIGVVGVLATWDRRGRLSVLYVMAGAYTAALLMFFVFARFRYPLAPIVILFAAAGIVEGWSFLRTRKRTTAWTAVAVLAVAIVANWPLTSAGPGRAVTYNNAGVALFDRGESAKAAELYRRALDHKPDYVEAHHNLGLALAREGDPEQAIAHFRRAVELKPELAAVHVGLGNALVRQGRADDGAAHCLEAVRLRPRSAEGLVCLGTARSAQGRIDEALAHWMSALQLDPESAETHGNLGIALAQKGRLEEAVGHLDKSVRLDPGSAEGHYNAGAVHALAGNVGKAVAALQEALRISPDFVDAHLQLARMLAGRGEAREAARHYREVLRLRPDWRPLLDEAAPFLETRPEAGGTGEAEPRSSSPVE